MPVGICGTARLMDAYSCRSGRSSRRSTGSGRAASSARARNDSLLICAPDAARSSAARGTRRHRATPRARCGGSWGGGGVRESIGGGGGGGLRGAVRTEPRRPGCRRLSVGVPALRGPPGFSAPGPTWRTLQTPPGCAVSPGPTPSLTVQPSPRCVVRLRAAEPGGEERRRRGGGGGVPPTEGC